MQKLKTEKEIQVSDVWQKNSGRGFFIFTNACDMLWSRLK